MLELYLAISIFLIITCLVVRDRTAFKLSRLRTELMALRNEEKRTSEVLIQIGVLISRISDDILRAERRQFGLEKASKQLSLLLEDLTPIVRKDEKEAAALSAKTPKSEDTAEQPTAARSQEDSGEDPT